uniref:Uncharacterized protein LOC111133975 n=1 Tax=Crassostrea virginica TaxID=6565 RepID=A0A8B8EE98_CRAVI|nr:uncharacterized protein LOC111133975 [Crassostrea virginica]
MGTAKYKMSCGVITLQIEEIDDQQYCFAFVLSLLNDTSLWNGTEFTPPLSGPLSGINGHKCILTDFNEVSIKSLQSPTHCMMNQGNSSQYLSCEEKLKDECQRIGKGL